MLYELMPRITAKHITATSTNTPLPLLLLVFVSLMNAPARQPGNCSVVSVDMEAWRALVMIH